MKDGQPKGITKINKDKIKAIKRDNNYKLQFQRNCKDGNNIPGTTITAYLLDNKQANKICKILDLGFKGRQKVRILIKEQAFKQYRIAFTKKASLTGNSTRFGYLDETYSRVKYKYPRKWILKTTLIRPDFRKIYTIQLDTHLSNKKDSIINQLFLFIKIVKSISNELFAR